MKKLSTIVSGSSKAAIKQSDFFSKVQIYVIEKLESILNQVATVGADITSGLGVTIHIKTVVKDNNVKLNFSVVFEVPAVLVDDYSDLDTTVAKQLQSYDIKVPPESLESEETFTKFVLIQLDILLNGVITAVKDDKSILETALKNQAIYVLVSANNYTKEQLEEVKKEVMSMNFTELLSRKGPLAELARSSFPFIGYDIDSRISGDFTIDQKEDGDKNKKQEPPSSSSKVDKDLLKSNVEENASRSEVELQEKTLKAEKGEEKKESPIQAPAESKTVIENNNQKESASESSIIKESTSTIKENQAPLLEKDLKDYTDEELKQKGISEDEILTLRLFSVFEEDAKKKKQEEAKKAQIESQKAESTKATTGGSKKAENAADKTGSISSTESSDQSSSFLRETNAQLVDQSLAQIIILSSINDSISGLKEVFQSYINVSNKEASKSSGITDTIKDLISLNSVNKESSSLDKSETKGVIEQTASLIPQEVKNITENVIPKIDVMQQKDIYSNMENKISSAEANTISKNDVTSLGENLNNSIKTAITNSPITNNTNIQGAKVSNETAAPIAVPGPQNSTVVQDNSASQGSVGSAGPTTVNLSNTTIDSIANAIVKSLTLTPFLNHGK